jgi:hypothetical protein
MDPKMIPFVTSLFDKHENHEYRLQISVQPGLSRGKDEIIMQGDH